MSYYQGVCCIIFLVGRRELLGNALKVQRETISLWLMYIERLISFWIIDQVLVQRTMKKNSWNGARNISLIVAPWGVLVRFTGCLLIFLVLYTSFCWSQIRFVAAELALLNLMSVFFQPNSRKCWTNGPFCCILRGQHASVSKMSCCFFLPQSSFKTIWWTIQVFNLITRHLYLLKFWTVAYKVAHSYVCPFICTSLLRFLLLAYKTSHSCQTKWQVFNIWSGKWIGGSDSPIFCAVRKKTRVHSFQWTSWNEWRKIYLQHNENQLFMVNWACSSSTEKGLFFFLGCNNRNEIIGFFFGIVLGLFSPIGFDDIGRIHGH